MLAQRASRVQLSKQHSASLHSRPGCIGKLHAVRTQAATEQLKQQSIIPVSGEYRVAYNISITVACRSPSQQVVATAVRAMQRRDMSLKNIQSYMAMHTISRDDPVRLHGLTPCLGNAEDIHTSRSLLPAAALALSWAAALPAAAEDVAVDSGDAAAASGFGPSTLLVLLPLVLYGVFNVYRTNANPKATFNDFLFLCAGLAVIGNIISIVVFKVRYF